MLEPLHVPDSRDTHTDVWLQVAAAVDYLSEGHRPGLTVWDALEEAVRWWIAAHLDPADGDDGAEPADLPWDDPDPLRTTLERLLTTVGPIGALDGAILPDALTAAAAAWVSRMCDRYNDGQAFARLH